MLTYRFVETPKALSLDCLLKEEDIKAVKHLEKKDLPQLLELMEGLATERNWKCSVKISDLENNAFDSKSFECLVYTDEVRHKICCFFEKLAVNFFYVFCTPFAKK